MFYKQTAPELNTKKRKYQMAPRPCLFTTFLFYANHWMQIYVMQIEKALITDRLRVSKVSSKFCIPNLQ